MNIKYLLQALKFAFIPTLITLALLCIGFFSFIDTWNFITSNKGWAIFIRILLFIAEVGLIISMYFYYKERGELENPNIDNISYRSVGRNNTIGELFRSDYSSDYEYTSYGDRTKNVITIKRTRKD